jgi:hypothetical protein
MFLLTSCDKPIETISPDNSEVVESVTPSPVESPSASLEPSLNITPTPTYTFTPHPSPTPTPTETETETETPIPEKPETFTPEKYFTFDAMHGTILDYDIEGGDYVNIPDRIGGVVVERIGRYAFAYKSLYGVIIPDTVKKIDEGAFLLSGLQKIDFGKGIEQISDLAFSNNQLSEIQLPDTLIYIGNRVFDENKLSDVIIPDSVTYIGVSAFNDLSEENIHLGDSLTSYLVIEDDTIKGHIGVPGVELVIPYLEGVTKIADYAFEKCDKTSVITIAEGINEIGADAFTAYNANVSGCVISLPASVVFIGYNSLPNRNNNQYKYELGSYAEHYAKNGKYEDHLAMTKSLYDFPLNRQQVIDSDISLDIRSTDSMLCLDWIRRYICTKYIDKDINSCNIYQQLQDNKYSYTYDNICEGYSIVTGEFGVSLSTDKDIVGFERQTNGSYVFHIQAVVVTDSKNKYILSGLLEENEMINSRLSVYEYMVKDIRFTTNKPEQEPVISNIQDSVSLVDLSLYSVNSEFLNYTGANYVLFPIGTDRVAFYLPDPVNKLQIFNFKTNEVIFSKDYDNISTAHFRYSDQYAHEEKEVIQFRYYSDSKLYADYIDVTGSCLEQKIPLSSTLEYDIPNTNWKVKEDAGNIYLVDINSSSEYILLDSKTLYGRTLRSYGNIKVLDENRFVFGEKTPREGGISNYELYIYDIPSGNYYAIQKENGFYIFTNKNTADVSQVAFQGALSYQDSAYLYDVESNNIDNLKSWVDFFKSIKQGGVVSDDGQYFAFLTSDISVEEGYGKSRSTGIVLLNLNDKKVMIQDRMELENGRISFLQDNTLVIFNGKTLTYIDTDDIN